MKLRVRRMCGGACWPWRYGLYGRMGLLLPRRDGGALIIDNLGIAIVYRNHEEWTPRRVDSL